MTTSMVRTATIDAESEYNAGIDATAIVDRMRDAGWAEGSRVWSPRRPEWADFAIKGWLWANAAAGGRLTITFVRDASTTPHHAIARVAEKLGALEAVEDLSRELARELPWTEHPYATIGLLRASNRLGAGSRAALAALPPRLRLYVEYALAFSIAATFTRPASRS